MSYFLSSDQLTEECFLGHKLSKSELQMLCVLASSVQDNLGTGVPPLSARRISTLVGLMTRLYGYTVDCKFAGGMQWRLG